MLTSLPSSKNRPKPITWWPIHIYLTWWSIHTISPGDQYTPISPGDQYTPISSHQHICPVRVQGCKNRPILRLSRTFTILKTHLKSHLFNLSFPSVWLYYWLHHWLSLYRALEAACAAYASLNLSSLHYITLHYPLRFLARCCTKRLNQALSILSLSLDSSECGCCVVNFCVALFCVVCSVSWLFLLGCQYQCKWLTGKTRLRDDL